MGLLHTKYHDFGDRHAQAGGLLVLLDEKGMLWIKAVVDAPPAGELKEFFDAGNAPVLGVIKGEVWKHATVRSILKATPAGQRLIEFAGGLEPGESKELHP